MSPEGFWEHGFLHPQKINLRTEGQWQGEDVFEETIWENPVPAESPAPLAQLPQNIPISRDFRLR